MQVGDLVTLSAYGKQRNRTGWVRHGDVGVIKNVGVWDTYRILWSNSIYKHSTRRDYTPRGNYWDWSLAFDRRDLKFAK